jgi:hypothetical protein
MAVALSDPGCFRDGGRLPHEGARRAELVGPTAGHLSRDRSVDAAVNIPETGAVGQAVGMVTARERHAAQRLLVALGRSGTGQGERQVLQLVGPAERVRLQLGHVARPCAKLGQPQLKLGH